ncbi:hypothetical protein SRB5_32070 [Streptomyces sp. RB5]|uniref:Uncharacterized protein n=1 Tax=Streptomyces smaragdinus TaxID=2585196 RepID=A0A7K0CHW8_9ACTN|nr:hypothetical protein [Streptomyces smaragdinus]
MRAEERLERLRNDWNHLCTLAGYWRSVPGFRASRWHKLDFRNAESERWYQEQLSYSGLESRVVSPAASDPPSTGDSDRPA